MASRPLLAPYSVITNGDMSASITSSVTILSNVSMISYSYSWSGTSPVGVITIEASNDYTQSADGSVRNPGTWNELVLSSTTNVSGNTGVGMINIDSIPSYAIRTKYIPSSGTGTLQAVVVGKVK